MLFLESILVLKKNYFSTDVLVSTFLHYIKDAHISAVLRIVSQKKHDLHTNMYFCTTFRSDTNGVRDKRENELLNEEEFYHFPLRYLKKKSRSSL